MNQTEYKSYGDCTVLITGGTGSIGLELCKSLLKTNIMKLRLFSNDENGLFEAKALLGPDSRIDYRLGDVRDPKAVDAVMSDCDVVFHAAALKHVNFCEENPREAISTNIDGTQNVVDSALKSRVQRFIFISTDKAVNPINTMGATKLLAEKLTLNASKMNHNKTFCCVRFGNVLGTRGSVLRIFERQIRNNFPVTVRDSEMTRFIMLPSDASELVLEAGRIAKAGETFVLKMPAVRLGDLARASITFFCRLYHKDASSVRIEEVSPSPGEKFHEELMTTSECKRAKTNGRFLVIPSSTELSPGSLDLTYSNDQGYSSNAVELLKESEILNLLETFSWER